MEKSIKNEEYYKIYPEQKKYQKGNNAPLVMFFRLLFFAHLSVQKLVKLFVPTLSLTNFGHLNQDINNISSLKLIIGQAVYGENYAAFRV